MKYVYFFIALVLLSSCNPNSKKSKSDESITSSDSLTVKEAEYLKTRDAYIEQFKPLQKDGVTESLLNMDKKALKDLEVRLRDILKDSKFSDQGKNNLETLLGFLGFGMMDGLYFEKDSMRIFYTSRNLFLNYVKLKQVGDLTSEAFGVVFHSAFFADAAVENYFSSKIKSSKNIEAYGTVGLVTQMNSPFPPNHIFVFASTDKYVYMIAKEVNGRIRELPQCKSVGDSINAEAQKHGERYRASNLKDTAEINEEFRLEEIAFKKYRECYQKEFASDPQFEAVRKQLESMVKYLEP